MLDALKEKLGAEVERLQHELNVVLPAEIRRAVELGDLKENSEYKSALERQAFVQARLGNCAAGSPSSRRSTSARSPPIASASARASWSRL